MWRCEQFKEELPQYVADGEPASPYYRALRAHLASCPSCQEELQRLRWVEEALRCWPKVPAPSALLERVMQAIVEQPHSVRMQERWQPLTWEVWVPALAVLAGLMIAVFSLPPHLLNAPVAVPGEEASQLWARDLASWESWLEGHREIVGTVWNGVFAALAVFGIGFALASWDALGREWWKEVERYFADLGNQVRLFFRRIH